MNSILEKKQNEIGLIGHVICDFPSKELCRASLKVMEKYKVALAEVQIPCSEPIADGSLFMKANHQAIASGVRVQDVFELLAETPDLPKVIMCYLNNIYKYGLSHFFKQASRVGAKGIIIPDLPVELGEEVFEQCEQNSIPWIPIVTPNMTDARMKQVVEKGGCFVYSVARSGVTGQKTELDHSIANYLARIRKCTDLPLGVGFGISHRSHVETLKGHSDYAIVGSAAMRALLEGGIPELESFWDSLS